MSVTFDKKRIILVKESDLVGVDFFVEPPIFNLEVKTEYAVYSTEYMPWTVDPKTIFIKVPKETEVPPLQGFDVHAKHILFMLEDTWVGYRVHVIKTGYAHNCMRSTINMRNGAFRSHDRYMI